MTEPLEGRPTVRRRRSDAQRNLDAIVSAARVVLRERSDASMEEIAEAASLSRQTVYSHFPSRDELITAVINAELAEGFAAAHAARLDKLAPVDALRRFLDISLQIVERCPLLLDSTLTRKPGADGEDPHRPFIAVLERIIRRGQRSGEFHSTLPATWLAVATIALGHTAIEQVATGTLSIAKAKALLDKTILRLYDTE